MRGHPNIGTLREHAISSVQYTRIACVNPQSAEDRSRYDAKESRVLCVKLPSSQS